MKAHNPEKNCYPAPPDHFLGKVSKDMRYDSVGGGGVQIKRTHASLYRMASKSRRNFCHADVVVALAMLEE